MSSLQAATQSLQQAGISVLSPGDAQYAERQDSYWSNSAKLKPASIVLPATTEEVAAAIKALSDAGQQFAVRSGGHTNWAGSNNIDGGVTIDLSKLNTTFYNAASETASIGPGNRWRDVYAELHKHRRVVAGGREGNVGVAGLVLGGGNTFFTAQRGFACDNVIEYEVVLATGRIVKASAEENSDLFQCLKGGSNNFGVVTSFKMSVIKCDKVWGGMTLFPKQVIPSAIDAFITFTDNLEKDKESNLVCILTHNPEVRDIVVATLYAHVGGVEEPKIFEEWLKIPQIMNSVKMTSVSDMAFEYNIPTHYHDIWFTCCFKNDARILTEASRLHDILVGDLQDFIPNGDFITQCLFQPLPRFLAHTSASVGGNVMGLNRQKHNGVLFMAVVMARTEEQEAFAYPKVKAWLKAVQDFAATIEGGNMDWVYLNYADKSQEVLQSYGAENLAKMKAVAEKYDPSQVFQKLVPGGFKLADV